MRILRLDSVGGASGDMILGVLIGLGADREKLEKRLHELLPDHFRLSCEPVVSHGLAGVRAKVEVQVHADSSGRGQEPHRHFSEPGNGHHAHHNFRDIRRGIENSGLPEAVKRQSIAVFRLLAEAEGKIHGQAPDEVAFHEIGAIDSIVDIVGCCLAYFELGLEGIELSVLPTGVGTVKCAHGLLPIPAPATAEIIRLSGLAVTASDEPCELLTPTGAALLASWPKAPPAWTGRVAATVNSFGQRTLQNRPNLLRGLLLESGGGPTAAEEVVELAANLDDLSPELAGELFRRLLAAGALDVSLQPLIMKKQRPGVLLSVIARSADRDRLLRIVFRESTTFGVREYPIRRQMLERRFETVDTVYGPVKMKIGRWQGEDTTVSPEFEDCRLLAEQHEVPVKEVFAAAVAAWRR